MADNETPEQDTRFDDLTEDLLKLVRESTDWRHPLDAENENWVNAGGSVGIHELLDLLRKHDALPS